MEVGGVEVESPVDCRPRLGEATTPVKRPGVGVEGEEIFPHLQVALGQSWCFVGANS